MSIFSKFARLASILMAMLALGAVTTATANATTTTAPAAALGPTCHAAWQFDIIQKTPHQSVYFEQGAWGPTTLKMSVKRTITKKYSISVSVDVSAKLAIFASISASGTVGFEETVTTAQQTSVAYKVRKGEHLWAADILKHWTVYGHLYFLRSDCHRAFSSFPTVNVYWPFDWNHRDKTPFTNY